MAGLLSAPSAIRALSSSAATRFSSALRIRRSFSRSVILPLGQVVDIFPGHSWVTFNGVLGELQNTGFRCLGHDKALIQE